MEEEIPTKTVILVCQQPECENYGIQIELVIPEDCVTYFCGPCSQRIITESEFTE